MDGWMGFTGPDQVEWALGSQPYAWAFVLFGVVVFGLGVWARYSKDRTEMATVSQMPAQQKGHDRAA